MIDPLSDVLSLLKPTTYKAGGFDVGGDFSIHFPDHPGIKCYAVTSGSGWLAFDDGSATVRLSAGDCFILPTGRGFRLATNLATPAREFYEILADMLQDCTSHHSNMRVINGGGGLSIVGGFFVLSGEHSNIFREALPPIAHLRTDSDREALRWAMDRMRQELAENRPGGLLVAQHLAHMMFVQALRLHVEQGNGTTGWLAALADKQMAAAIGAIHSDPARAWTLEQLATRAGMSRSSFAANFKAKVTLTPIEYLTRWRMMLAADKVMHTASSVGEIAVTLGYESESSFSTAFKRVMGCSPRQYARRETNLSAPPSLGLRQEPQALAS